MATDPVTGKPAAGSGLPPFMQPPPSAAPADSGSAGFNPNSYLGSAGLSGYNQHNHMRNQMITSAGVTGLGGGAMLSGFSGFNPNSGTSGNPMNMAGGNPQFGSANFYLRQIANTDLIIAANTRGGGSAAGGYPGWASGGFYGNQGNMINLARSPPGYPNNPYHPPPGNQPPGNSPPGNQPPGNPPPGNQPPGGGFGHMATPFASYVGLSHTASALGSMGIGVVPLVAAKIIEELAVLPQSIAGAEQGWMNKTGQIRGYIDSTSQMGQAGSFNSNNLRNRLSQNPALGRAGLGPDEGAAMLARLGVVPTSDIMGNAVVNELAGARIRPGLSNIPAEMHGGVLRNMLGIGATSLPNIDKANAELQNIMKQTAATGQDQLRVLRSIDTGVVTLSTAPGAATAISPTDLFRANQRFISTPAGMAGVAGENVITATQNAWAKAGTDPATTIVATNLVDKLQTEKDLSNFFGKDAWEKYTSTPAGANGLRSYLQDIKNGDRLGAMFTLTNAFLKDPTLAATDNGKNALVNNMITDAATPGGGRQLRTQQQMTGRDENNLLTDRPTGNAGWDANNPLNLTYAGQPGAKPRYLPNNPEKITLATFPSMAAGVAADINQLRINQGKGANTVRKMMNMWNPNGMKNDPVGFEKKIQATAAGMGIHADAPMDMNDPGMAAAYVRSAQPGETGPFKVSPSDLTLGSTAAFTDNPNNRPAGTPDPNIPGYNPTIGRAKQDVLGAGELTLKEGKAIIDTGHGLEDAAWGIVSKDAHDLAASIDRAVSVMSQTRRDAGAGAGASGLPPM